MPLNVAGGNCTRDRLRHKEPLWLLSYSHRLYPGSAGCIQCFWRRFPARPVIPSTPDKRPY